MAVNSGKKAKINQPLISRLENTPFLYAILRTNTTIRTVNWHMSSEITASDTGISDKPVTLHNCSTIKSSVNSIEYKTPV